MHSVHPSPSDKNDDLGSGNTKGLTSLLRLPEPPTATKRTMMDELLVDEHHGHAAHSKYICRKSLRSNSISLRFSRLCCNPPYFVLPLIQNISPPPGRLSFFLPPGMIVCHFHRDTDPFGVRRYWDIVTTLLVLYLCWRIPFDLGLDWWYPPKQLKSFELFADIWFGKTCL